MTQRRLRKLGRRALRRFGRGDFDPKRLDPERIRDGDRRYWGPDLFAWAYDLLDESQLWRGRADPEDFEHETLVVGWRDRIRDGGGWVPDELIVEIGLEVAAASDPAQILLAVVVAVDRAYAGMRVTRPIFVTDTESLLALATEWEARGSLQRTAPGLVVRKGSHWRAGSALAHYCNDLGRVSASLAVRVKVMPQNKQWSLGSLARAQGDDFALDLAFVPLLHETSDIELSPTEVGGHRFRIGLDEAKQAALCRDAEQLIAGLEAAGANVALFPECVASDALVNALRQAMIENNRVCHDELGIFPNLRLLVVGKGGARSNRAVVIGANGKTLFTQAKTQRWRLTVDQQKRYGLDIDFGSVDRSEDIDEEFLMTYLDDSGFGRIGVLICEDLHRNDPAHAIGISATPTMILSPVLDGSLAKHRWAYKAAERVAAEPATLVAVATSFVLALREARNGGPDASKVGIGALVHPNDHSQSGIITAPSAPDARAIRVVTWTQAWG